MRRGILLALVVCVMAAPTAAGAEREWQNGIWREVKVERPKVLFSAQPHDPNSNVPRTAAAREVRTYVIDTRTHRLELRQDATVDTPRIEVLLEQPVLVAIEKKTVYVKDNDGREHKLSLRKLSPIPQAE
jgi:hypothetical protein